MTNEEKAQKICEKNKRFYVECSSLECYLSALEMAKWKDEQFKQILRVIYSKTLSIEKDFVIEQIFKKLFKEDLNRNELEKDELKNILEKLKEQNIERIGTLNF